MRVDKSRMIPVRLRKAVEADSEFLFNLRNDEAVRRNSFHTEPVPREDHEAWLRHVLASEDRALFIAENGETGEAVGQIRLDDEDDKGYEISYSVAPAFRGQRVGTIMIGVLMQMLASPAGDMRVFARVKPENQASQSIFVHNGFSKVRATDDYIEFERYVHEA